MIDENRIFPLSFEVVEDSGKMILVDCMREKIEQKLCELAAQAQTPIHYFTCRYGVDEDSFYRLPHDGMLAFLQFKHNVAFATSFALANSKGFVSLLPCLPLVILFPLWLRSFLFSQP